jgi:hypothetical protein
MNVLSKTTLLLIIFAVAGLIGPLIQWIAWPPSEFATGASESMASFVSDVVFLTWPSQMLAVVGGVGPTVATALAVVANVCLFGILGATTAMLASHTRGYVVVYSILACLIALLALWGAGFNTAHLSVLAMLVALMIYATPFYIAWRVAA